jgi:hypothetical protein
VDFSSASGMFLHGVTETHGGLGKAALLLCSLLNPAEFVN